jgi:hypothetical protein
MGTTKPSERRPTIAASPQPPLVVVADDDQSLRAFYRAALERAGFQVRVARNGRHALELVRANDVAVLLLDLAMPGLNGLETLQELRGDPALRTLPVIIATVPQLRPIAWPAWTKAPTTSSSNPSPSPNLSHASARRSGDRPPWRRNCWLAAKTDAGWLRSSQSCLARPTSSGWQRPSWTDFHLRWA